MPPLADKTCCDQGRHQSPPSIRLEVQRQVRSLVAWWKEHIHMIIDCKTFPAYVTSRGRSYAAQREIRGAYRKLGQGMDDAYVVSPKELKFNPGCSAVKIVAGVTVTGPSRARPFSAMLCHDKFCTLPLDSNARTSFNARPCTRAAHGSRRVSVG